MTAFQDTLSKKWSKTSDVAMYANEILTLWQREENIKTAGTVENVGLGLWFLDQVG